VLQIQEEKEVNRLRRSKATVIEELDGTVHIQWQGRELKYKELLVREHQGKVVDRKSISLAKRKILAATAPSSPEGLLVEARIARSRKLGQV